MNQENEYIDNEFDQYLQRLEDFLINYKYREKFLLTQWLTKLKKSNSTVEERKLRNRFLKHFLNNPEMHINVFTSEPFKDLPENFTRPLMDLKTLLPKDPTEALNPTEDEKRCYISELFNTLPDKGSFLAEQPVPRDGSFYITVLRRNEAIFCPKPYNLNTGGEAEN